MSLHSLSVASFACLVGIAATPRQANDIRLDQSNPTIMTLNITQIRIDHVVHGLDTDTVVMDPTSGATVSRNFDTVSLQQTSVGNSTIALNIDVGLDAPSNSFIDIAGGGSHSVILAALAQDLTSIITLEGSEAKSVSAIVDAAGKLVSHDIRLSGNTIDLTANQQAAVDLSVDLFSMGPRSSVSINQTGEASTAHILGTIDTNATLMFDQTSVETDYALDVTLNPDSTLTFNQTAGGGGATGSKATVGTGQTITITQ